MLWLTAKRAPVTTGSSLVPDDLRVPTCAGPLMHPEMFDWLPRVRRWAETNLLETRVSESCKGGPTKLSHSGLPLSRPTLLQNKNLTGKVFLSLSNRTDQDSTGRSGDICLEVEVIAILLNEQGHF